jgi:excisionase family DNA binding protein
MLDRYPDVLSSKEVMEILDISKVLLYEMIREKKLKAYKVGREWRYNKNTLIKNLIALEK